MNMESISKPGRKVRLIGTGHAEGLGGNANATPGGDVKGSFRHFQRVNLRRSLAGWMGEDATLLLFEGTRRLDMTTSMESACSRSTKDVTFS